MDPRGDAGDFKNASRNPPPGPRMAAPEEDDWGLLELYGDHSWGLAFETDEGRGGCWCPRARTRPWSQRRCRRCGDSPAPGELELSVRTFLESYDFAGEDHRTVWPPPAAAVWGKRLESLPPAAPVRTSRRGGLLNGNLSGDIDQTVGEEPLKKEILK